uniref:Putative secreted protein n=1 Tax=Anopheles marajoara TaxID=58244 RepID=A0A2M4CBH2_9DIPT
MHGANSRYRTLLLLMLLLLLGRCSCCAKANGGALRLNEIITTRGRLSRTFRCVAELLRTQQGAEGSTFLLPLLRTLIDSERG